MASTMQAFQDIDFIVEPDSMDLGSEAGNLYMDEDMTLLGDSTAGNGVDDEQDVELQDARSETARGSQVGEPDAFMADLVDEINYSDEEIEDGDTNQHQQIAEVDQEIANVPEQELIVDVEAPAVAQAPQATASSNAKSDVQHENPTNTLGNEEKPFDWDQDFIDYSDDEAPEGRVDPAPAADNDAGFDFVETAEQHEETGDYPEDETADHGAAESTEQDPDESAEHTYDNTIGQDFTTLDDEAYDGYTGQEFDEFAAEQIYGDAAEETYIDAAQEPYEDASVHTNEYSPRSTDAAVQTDEDAPQQTNEGRAKENHQETVGQTSEDALEQDFDEFAGQSYDETVEQSLNESPQYDHEEIGELDLPESGNQAPEGNIANAPKESTEQYLVGYSDHTYGETIELSDSAEHADEQAGEQDINEFAESTYDETTTLDEAVEHAYVQTEERGLHDPADETHEDSVGEQFGETIGHDFDETDKDEPNELAEHEFSETEQQGFDTGGVKSGETVEAGLDNSAKLEQCSTADAGWKETEDESAMSNANQEVSAERGESDHRNNVDTTAPDDDFVSDPLHPVSVRYDGHEMMLFPLQTSETNHTYLLSDESVAYGTILDLFQACRQCLGDSIGEDTELRLDLPGLKLEFSEDFISCNSISLTKILSIYKELKAADGVQDAPPLEMILRKCENPVTSRLAWLEECADTNLGFLASQEKPEPSDQPVQHQEYNEESDEEYGEESISNDPGDQIDDDGHTQDQQGSKRTFVEFEEEEEHVDDEDSSPKRVKTAE